MSPEVINALVETLASVRARGVSLMVATSRRTPELAGLSLQACFGADAGTWLWTGEEDGPNPYDAFLADADVVLVTKDSTNMITEAATAGKPVLLLDMAGADGKFAALYAELARRNLARPYEGDLTPWPVEPLKETDRAAAEIAQRLEAHASAGA
jgi:mitochondrial fission protein ELM1